MARKPGVRYFASRGAYYCQWQGRQYPLAKGPEDAPTGATYLAALEAFRRLMQGRLDQGDHAAVAAIIEAFLEHAEGRVEASSLAGYLSRLCPFAQACGKVLVTELTHAHVEAFLQAQRGCWGRGTAATFMQVLATAFNWAARRGLISKNPIADMDRPSAPSRSRDCLLTPALHAKVLAACRSPSLRNFLIALEDTGARPGELAAATARDWDDALGAIVYHGDDHRRQDEFRHKSAKHKDRFIHFTGSALEMIRQAVRQRPEGPLFPSQRGRRYGPQSIARSIRCLADHVGLPRMTAYSYRHTFATNWLRAGKSIEILAELLGNTPATIRKHYSHVCGDPQVRKHLEDFRKAEEGTSTSGEAS